MLSVVRVHLPTGIPIAGCELSAYVLLRRSDSTLSPEDVTEASSLDGYYLQCRWYFTSTSFPCAYDRRVPNLEHALSSCPSFLHLLPVILFCSSWPLGAFTPRWCICSRTTTLEFTTLQSINDFIVGTTGLDDFELCIWLQPLIDYDDDMRHCNPV